MALSQQRISAADSRTVRVNVRTFNSHCAPRRPSARAHACARVAVHCMAWHGSGLHRLIVCVRRSGAVRRMPAACKRVQLTTAAPPCTAQRASLEWHSLHAAMACPAVGSTAPVRSSNCDRPTYRCAAHCHRRNEQCAAAAAAWLWLVERLFIRRCGCVAVRKPLRQRTSASMQAHGTVVR